MIPANSNVIKDIGSMCGYLFLYDVYEYPYTSGDLGLSRKRYGKVERPALEICMDDR